MTSPRSAYGCNNPRPELVPLAVRTTRGYPTLRHEYSVRPSAASLHVDTCTSLAASCSWQVFSNLYVTIFYSLRFTMALCPYSNPVHDKLSHLFVKASNPKSSTRRKRSRFPRYQKEKKKQAPCEWTQKITLRNKVLNDIVHHSLCVQQYLGSCLHNPNPSNTTRTAGPAKFAHNYNRPDLFCVLC